MCLSPDLVFRQEMLIICLYEPRFRLVGREFEDTKEGQLRDLSTDTFRLVRRNTVIHGNFIN